MWKVAQMLGALQPVQSMQPGQFGNVPCYVEQMPSIKFSALTRQGTVQNKSGVEGSIMI